MTTTDYTALIDSETWAFIRKTDSYYPPDAVDHSVSVQREVYDRMCRAFHAGNPATVATTTTTIPGVTGPVPVRIYRKDAGTAPVVVLYYHGGGFILGGLESHDDVCAEICDSTGYEVVSVDYRLVPEHRHPAAFQDAYSAFEWAAGRDGAAILLCGDSAGGNLAAAVAHAARGHARAPIGQVLIYPGLGGDQTRGSYVTHAHAPMLTVRDMDYYRDLRAGGRDIAQDPTFAPLSDTDFAGVPPTVVITAECDPLSSDGETYRDRIRAAGGRAFWHEERGLVHGYLRARHSVARARDSFARITGALSALGQNAWPFEG